MYVVCTQCSPAKKSIKQLSKVAKGNSTVRLHLIPLKHKDRAYIHALQKDEGE